MRYGLSCVLALLAILATAPQASAADALARCPSATYVEGEHFGFRIGMSRAEARDIAAQRYPRHLSRMYGATVVYPLLAKEAGWLERAKRWQDLPAVAQPLEIWEIRRGPTLCLFWTRFTKLTITDGFITSITSEPHYLGP